MLLCLLFLGVKSIERLLLFLIKLLLMLLLDLLKWIFFLWQYRFHISKLLLKRCEHLLAHLKLDSPWMVLYGKSILTEVLNEKLVLPLVLTLSHLEDHILITFYFLWLIGTWSLALL